MIPSCRMISTFGLSLGLALMVAACSHAPKPGQEPEAALAPQQVFMANLKTLCGKAFAGRMVSTDALDADMADKPMVMHVASCEEKQVRVPFHVDQDRSRTWVISVTDAGLRLKHDHRHEDGSEDALTQYGGDTADIGSPNRQSFPVDVFSKDMFERTGRQVSMTNIWAVEVEPGKKFAYELRRENRFFRVEFDLSKPVQVPPPAWGAPN